MLKTILAGAFGTVLAIAMLVGAFAFAGWVGCFFDGMASVIASVLTFVFLIGGLSGALAHAWGRTHVN